MMYMVRKQLYVTEDQDVRLKRMAAEQGVSEAELVRRALDRALSEQPARRWRPGRSQALASLSKAWSSPDWVLPERFERDQIYRERLDRLAHQD